MNIYQTQLYWEHIDYYLAFIRRYQLVTSAHIGIPQTNIKKHRPTVNRRRCFSRYCGQLSTKPVTSASTLQNSESTPRTFWQKKENLSV